MDVRADHGGMHMQNEFVKLLAGEGYEVVDKTGGDDEHIGISQEVHDRRSGHR